MLLVRNRRTKLELASFNGRGLATVQARRRLSPQLRQVLLGHLTELDYWLLHMLHQHRVFTTTQIAAMGFDSSSTARHRLHWLTQWRALDRFRPQTMLGSAPWHYTLGAGGAEALTAHPRAAGATIRYDPDQAVTLANSPLLHHTLAVNQVFTDLLTQARTPGTGELAIWRGERECHQRWDSVRPDGYGLWRTGGTDVRFALELDRGTEPLSRLVAKVDAYAQLPPGRRIEGPILFQLPGPGREYHLHQALGHPAVPVATTTADLAHPDPAGPVWMRAGDTGTRLPLHELHPRQRLSRPA